MMLTILGSGSLVPSLKRGTQGFLLQENSTNILIDSGSGTLYRLLKAGLTYNDIDILCYTHCHLDHFADFPVFLFTSKYGIPPRATDLTVMGGKGFLSYYKKIQDIYSRTIESDLFDVNIVEMPDMQISGMTIRTCRIPHSPESAAYRFTSKDGKSVVISGDTDHSPDLVDLAEDTDLLVCECSYPDGMKVDGHLTPSYAGRMATEANAKKLVLTHLYPPTDDVDLVAQCAKEFKSEIVVANDGMEIEV
jgi:ribonuclease BN (tRNA processing enzyme)